MSRWSLLVVALALLPCAAHADSRDEPLIASVQAERLEYVADENVGVWDLQGYYGSDYRKLWWKTEGVAASGGDDVAEMQLLYSRAASAYFDWQLGLRVADEGPVNTTSIVIGLQGLAPYNVEIDIATFLSSDGELRLRAEFDRDFAVTPRLVLQPRIELKGALNHARKLEIDTGLNEVALGLRLRYEWHRKFAPYLGVSWTRLFGAREDAALARGVRDSSATAVVGFRFWL